jgi:PAS domain S-box-containing protein
VRLERDRNRAIIDTVFASVFAVDGGGRIIHANAAAARMFDRPMHALTGVVLSDMIATESLQMSVDEYGTITCHADVDGGRFSTNVCVFGRRAFPADVSVTPLVLEGQRAWAVFVHDLSAAQQIQSELQTARLVAEETNRAKTAFLARIGRELRAPLDAALGFTQVVLRSRSSQLSDRDRHYLERVHAGGEHLITLVSDILDLSQIDAGTIALDMADTDVTAVAQSLVAQFDAQVAGRPVLLASELPEVSAYACVDALRLRQVLTNLVSNAVKFTARGTITITVCTQGHGNRATAVIVRDTGIGIPLERQAHLFDLFAYADHDAVTHYSGSGLGLALSKRLATEMGCMLSVESMPGAGSTFTLAFAPAVPVSVPVTNRLMRRAR